MLTQIASFVVQASSVTGAVDWIKSFIPEAYTKWANPLLAIILGVATSYVAGGTEATLGVLMEGLGVGAAAVGAHAVPRAVTGK